MIWKNNIVEIIKAHEGEYSPKQKRIASYLLNNYRKAAFLTATQVAKETGVSQPTVIRFAQYLGFSNYHHFTEAFQDMVTAEITSTERLFLNLGNAKSASQDDSNIFSQEIRTLEFFANFFPKREVQQLVEKICSSNEIYIVGTRASASLSQYFAYFLGKVKRRVYPITSGSTIEYDRLITLEEKDLVIALAFPRYPSETLEIVRFCKSRGILVAGITDRPESPLSDLSDTVIAVPITFTTIFDSYCSVFCLFSMVVNGVGRMNKKESEKLIKRFEMLVQTINIFHNHQTKEGK